VIQATLGKFPIERACGTLQPVKCLVSQLGRIESQRTGCDGEGVNIVALETFGAYLRPRPRLPIGKGSDYLCEKKKVGK
jgi:hypothetical protein